MLYGDRRQGREWLEQVFHVMHRYSNIRLTHFGMCERGSSLPRIVDWPRGIGSGQPGVRSASPSCPAGLIPLDDVGGVWAALAQIALVVGATDPGPHRLIRRSVAGILFEDGGYLRRRRGFQVGDWLPAQYRSPLPP